MYYFENNEEFADRTMFVTEDEGSFTYRDIRAIQKKWLGDLPHRSLVFIVCRNSVITASAYLGCLDRGIVPLLLPESITDDQLTGLIEKYDPGFVLIPAERAGLIGGVSVMSDDRWDLRTTGRTSPPLHDDLALLLTTSGSTGSAKLVRLSKDNLQSNAESIAESLAIKAGDRPVTSLPMEYTYGLSVINSHVLKGAAVLITNSGILQASFWDFMKRERATSMSGVPYTYSLLERLRFRRMDLPSLEAMTQAGGRLSPELQKTFGEWAKERGIRFYVMYGQTEATARMAYLPYEKCLEKAGSIGIAIPGGAFSILTEDGKETTAPGASGELVYRGPNVSLGYAEKASDLSLGDERGGVLVTGDLARTDEDGYFYITGRKSRFVKIMGKRVNLDDLEKLLGAEYPQMSFLCGGSDEKVRILAVKDPVPGGEEAEALEDDIKSRIREKAGLPLASFLVHFAAEIPRTPSGKISYEHV